MKSIYRLKFLILIIFFICAGAKSRQVPAVKPEGGSDISVYVEKKDATAESAKDGEIHLKVSGGVPPHKVHIFSPYTFPADKQGSDLTFENLGTGDYLFVIQDQAGSTITKEVKIEKRK